MLYIQLKRCATNENTFIGDFSERMGNHFNGIWRNMVWASHKKSPLGIRPSRLFPGFSQFETHRPMP